jgi:hypothetical protein
MDKNEIADRILLRELVERYARIPDDRNYGLVDEIFSADACLAGPGFELSGLAEIRGAMQAIEQYSATLHCVHNHLVEIRGDEATGETWCVANHLHEVDGRPHKLDWGIRYQDLYRREPGGWRITRRELRVIWQQDVPLTSG